MTPFLGAVYIGAFGFAPNGYALCNGQLLSIQQNTALFALLGTTYGGNGVQTFALPNLQGRVPLHYGSGPGLSFRLLGEISGEQSHTLTVTEIPSHGHTAIPSASTAVGTTNSPVGVVWSKDKGTHSLTYSTGNPNAAMAAGALTVSNTGGGQPHENRQPFLTLTFFIALQGIFPSRN